MEDRKNNIAKKKLGAIVAAVVYCILIALYFGSILFLEAPAFASWPVLLIIGGVGLTVIICCIVALSLRLKEIEGGEEDEARKY
ncbi:MAG: hypothetical protein K6F84_07130 [Lachnospiraceae bacterium]|nr:hypothetical protein [Lachnospiraceae bacterium]